MEIFPATRKSSVVFMPAAMPLPIFKAAFSDAPYGSEHPTSVTASNRTASFFNLNLPLCELYSFYSAHTREIVSPPPATALVETSLVPAFLRWLLGWRMGDKSVY